MRVVLDTNIIVSALLAPAGKPAAIIRIWLDGKLTLLTCAAHLDELRSTLEKPRVSERIKPHKAGRLVNQVKEARRGRRPPAARGTLSRSHGRFSAGFVRRRQSRLPRDRRQERPAGPRPPQSHADRFRARIRRVVHLNPRRLFSMSTEIAYTFVANGFGFYSSTTRYRF
jgi:hypothetical protein